MPKAAIPFDDFAEEGHALTQTKDSNILSNSGNSALLELSLNIRFPGFVTEDYVNTVKQWHTSEYERAKKRGFVHRAVADHANSIFMVDVVFVPFHVTLIDCLLS